MALVITDDGAAQKRAKYAESSVEKCFSDDSLFHRALKEAFEGVLQQARRGVEFRGAPGDVLRPPAQEGRGREARRRPGGGDAREGGRAAGVRGDKDLFSEFYRKRLSKRLLFDQSANDDHGRSILTKLKQQCGAQFHEQDGGHGDGPPAREG